METNDYFDGRFQRQADVRVGRIESFEPPNVYMVRMILTSAIRRATPANRGDVFGVGELVCLNSPSASRAALGSGDLIVSRAPEEQQGLIGGTVTDDAELSGVTILSVSPRPLDLEQGGASGDVVIKGTGFLSAPTFDVGAGVTNAVAATVTPTQITIHAHAAADAPLGLSGVKVGTRKVKDVFRVKKPPLSIAWTVGGDATPKLYRLAAWSDLHVMNEYAIPNSYSSLMCSDGTTLYYLCNTAAYEFTLIRVTIATGVRLPDVVIDTTPTDLAYGGAPMAARGADLWFGTWITAVPYNAHPLLASIAKDGSGALTDHGGNITTVPVWLDFSNEKAAFVLQTEGGVRSIAMYDFASTAVATEATDQHAISIYGDDVVALHWDDVLAGDSTLTRRSTADLGTVLDTVALAWGAAAGSDGLYGFRATPWGLYAMRYDGVIKRISLVDFSELATLSLPNFRSYYSLDVNWSGVYVVSTDGQCYRLNRDTLALVTISDVLTGEGLNRVTIT